jgi:hypothetical protein
MLQSLTQSKWSNKGSIWSPVTSNYMLVIQILNFPTNPIQPPSPCFLTTNLSVPRYTRKTLCLDNRAFKWTWFLCPTWPMDSSRSIWRPWTSPMDRTERCCKALRVWHGGAGIEPRPGHGSTNYRTKVHLGNMSITALHGFLRIHNTRSLWS